jgi:hypothetical protein
MDHYLKFTDEAAFIAAAESAGLVRNGRVVSRVGAELDVIGEIRPLTGYTDDDPPQPIFGSVPGFHVNVRGELPEAFEPFVIDAPATPFRVWAK